VAVFAGEDARRRWGGPLKSALLLLADSGLGGRRSLGWGHSEAPEFTEGLFPEMILPAAETPLVSAEAEPRQTAWWLLSLFIPARGDAVDWSKGNYQLVTRGGRVESPAHSGEPKKLVRMLAEGSVLVASQSPGGAAPDVAPTGFPHPVYRAGYAVAVPIPVRPAEVKA
jgi:CRISPR type III-A-associated RAMP protein Csm4